VTADATSEQAPSLVRNVTAILRDFKLYDPNDATTNPDFEGPMHFDQNGNPSDSYFGPWDDRAIVTDALGADDKPVYKNATGGTLTTHGKASFDQWFTDVPGTNVRVEYPLVLTEGGAGIYTYDSQTSGAPLSTDDPTRMFFPIDDGTPNATVFGNQGDPHNYSFTLELHTVFTYQGGEFLHFRGDDDVFVYIDGKLVINLGGIHGPEVADVQADTLGLTIGKEYPLDFFYAERHKTGSNMLFMSTFQLRTVIIN
jgi:fibro-slime domain-containing protein